MKRTYICPKVITVELKSKERLMSASDRAVLNSTNKAVVTDGNLNNEVKGYNTASRIWDQW